MTEVRDDLVNNNKTVNWIPKGIGEGRFGSWLENVQDWGISRNRYWGTPLNIWECEECGYTESIGSRKELAERSGNPEDEHRELHRPYIDEVTFKCPHCGKTMHRVPEVIDCWFDSGAMPFAQHHYPFENKEVFERQFPAAFISEAVDQTRGWFYSLMAESTILFNKSPYENCLVLGHVLDEKGQKMSKSKGNAVDPFTALDKYGADAIRWYFYENSMPWLPNKFYGKAVEEGQRKFMGTLWNTYAFYVLYADIDSFDPTKYSLDRDSMTVMDRWILSRLNSVVGEVDDDLFNYRITEAARCLEDFVDELSNWYVRRSRDRFWAKGMEQDKINAYETLYTCLVTISKAAAPMIPFMTEEIYQNIVLSVDKDAPESIHLCDYPVVDESFIDKDLEDKMGLLLKIVTTGRAARNASNIKNRQPLSKMYIRSDEKLSDFYIAVIEDELNVKSAEFKDDLSSYTTYEIKPQLKTVGPKYGKLLGKIQGALKNLDGNSAIAKLDAEGEIAFPEIDPSVVLTKEDLLISLSGTEGYAAAGDSGVTVVLDINLTPELIDEGFVREIVSKVQTMRKEAGFEVADRIKVYYSGNDKISEIFNKFSSEISKEVLATELLSEVGGSYTKDWKINGEAVTLGVEKN